MLNKILLLAVLLPLMNAQAGSWTSYTNTDEVRQIVPDGNRIWAATSGGVISFNYATGDIIKLTNTDGLKGIDFKCAERDTSGSLWFGTSDGWLTRITASGAITNYAFRDSLGLIPRSIAIFDLKTDGSNLWVASDIGVSKFLPYRNNGEIKDNARQLGGIPREEDVVCLDIIGNNLWAGTAHGVAFINEDNLNIQDYRNWRSFEITENGLINADIRAIASFNDTVMVGTSNGIYELQVSPDTLWSLVALSGSTITSLYLAGPSLIASTNQGIFQYDGTNWTEIVGTGLPGKLANNLALDSRGILWAGTPASGLAEFTGSQWVLHSMPGPASNVIGKIAIDSSGGIWLPQYGKGLTRFYNGEWRIYNTSNSDPDGSGPLQGLFDDNEVSISVAPDSTIWVGSFGGGLYQYDWTSWHHWDTGNSPMYGTGNGSTYWAATAVLADPKGYVWVSSFGADSFLTMGVFAPHSSDSTWQLFIATQIGLTTNFVQAFKSQGDILWVGRGDGLDRLDTRGNPFDPSHHVWTTKIGTVGVADMEFDASGNLWVASSSGLFYRTPDVDSLAKMALPPEISGTVNAIAVDGVGNLWVGTVAGLGMLKPNRLEPNRSSWQTLYATDNSPLLGNNITDIAIDIPTGRIYIGTTTGLSIFESGILPPSPDLSDMAAYPNPVIVSEGIQNVEFKRVPSVGNLSIYTASGDLVIRFDLSQRNTWDLKNSNGESVAGGIYFFHVKSGSASGTGKIAIIK
jgi:ligand-binding sensor domain-containing protein